VNWHNNEDAGDLTMMGAADYSGHLGELMYDAHQSGEHEDYPHPDCPDCEEEE